MLNTSGMSLLDASDGHTRRRSACIHPGKQCGPCCLCHRAQQRYAHMSTMQEAHRLWLLEHEEPGPSDCICRRCAEDVRKHMGEASYIPVWKRMRKVRRNCIVANCSSEGVKGTAVIPNSVTCEVFECSIQGDDSVILCESHYTQLYNVWTSPERICTGCGRQRKHSKRFIRKCPNPELISRVLNLEKLQVVTTFAKAATIFTSSL